MMTIRIFRQAVAAAALSVAVFGCTETTGGDSGAGGDSGSDAGAGGSAGGASGSTGGTGGEATDGTGGEAGGAAAGGAGGDAIGGAGGGATGGAGGEEPASEACVATCERMANCAGEVCDGVDTGAVSAECEDACAANPAIATVGGGILECEELVDFGRDRVPALGEGCELDPVNPPMSDECGAYGARITECLVAECDNVSDYEDLIRASFTHICDYAVFRGETSPEQIDMFINANTPCDSEVMRATIDPQLAEEGMGDFCADGPELELDVCETACERLAPCLTQPEQEAIQNPARCQHLCVAYPNTVAQRTWECLAEAPPNSCEAIGPCFAPAPAVPECANVVGAVQRCTQAVCENVAGYEAGIGLYVDPVCREAVASGDTTVEYLAGLNEETSCDDEGIAGWVTFFTEDDPAEDDDGVFVNLCESGPRLPAETCEAACANIGPCVPEGSESQVLSDAEACAFFCGATEAIATMSWECSAAVEGGDCMEVFACFPQE